MTAWPGNLPAVPLLGYRETAPDTAIRTSMDSGPDKIRRRFTAAVRDIQFPLILNDSQVQTLDDFYVTASAGGTLRFDHIDPRTKSAVKMRFTGPPEYDLIAPTKWRVTVKLEILP